MTIIVHHLDNSRSHRILWLLEELGEPYKLRRYRRDPRTMLAPPELKKVHPLGKSPVVEDGPLVLAETGAIVEYLIAKYGGAFGEPSDTLGRQQYRYFLHYAEGSVMPPLLAHLALGRVPVLGGIAQRKFLPMINVHLDYVESELAQRSWFAGEEITAADVMMSYPLEAARKRVDATAGREHIGAWLSAIASRPAYQRALNAARG